MNDIVKWTENGVARLAECDLLDTVDNQQIIAIEKELAKAYITNQIFRTEVEATASVLNNTSFPTIPSKYWQSVREQMGQFQELIFLTIEGEIFKGKIDLLIAEIAELKSTPKDRANKRIKMGEIKKLEFSLIDMKRVAKDRVREIVMWETIKEECKKKEDFNTDDVGADQSIALEKRLKMEMKIAEQTGDKDLFRNSSTILATLLKLKTTGELTS